MPSIARGRPRDLRKRNAILDAGRELFGSGGAGAVTIEQVAAHAGVSRGTFYANFLDFDSFLETIARRESDRIVESAALAGAHGENLRTRLLHFGISLLTFLFDSRMQAFERRLTAEVETRPELARRFFDAGPAYVRNCLVTIVAGAIARGELVAGDPNDLVGDLIGLWQGFYRVELVFRAVPALLPQELAQRSGRGVDLFLKLYGCDVSAAKRSEPGP